jgi:hypothetical protein
MKKIIGNILVIILVVFFSFFCLSPLLNEIKLNNMLTELKNMPLPHDTILIEARSYCGNLVGTSNNIELWASILVKTELSEEKIVNYCHKMNKEYVKIESRSPDQFDFPNYRNIFDSLENIDSYDGYYAIYCVAEAVSKFDIRGH